MIPIIIAMGILLVFCVIDILRLEKKVKDLFIWNEVIRDENSNQWIHLKGNTESIGNILNIMKRDTKIHKLQCDRDKVIAEGFELFEKRFQNVETQLSKHENEIDRMKPKEVPKCSK